MMSCVLKSRRQSNFLKFVFIFILTVLMTVGCGDSDDGPTAYYRDSDGDRYGDPDVSIEDYTKPSGYVTDNTDCDDTNENIHGCCSSGIRFTDMGDGTVRDNASGLIWLKDANAFGQNDWYAAMNAAAALHSGEYGLSDGSIEGDWRLPTTAEWEAFMCRDFYIPGSLLESYSPALVNAAGDAQWSDGDAFTGVIARYYWSSSEYEPDYAWAAFMGNGYLYTSYKQYSGGYYVWPVRSSN